jgi:hypothetical protein
VPFVKITRDKRGYEHFSLVHTPTRRGKSLRPRVLYWYRTPPGVKVGRAPFDPAVRAALEAQNPDITFDWDKLSSTPLPAPDVEYWRERRRAERTAKLARRGERSPGGDATEADGSPSDAGSGGDNVNPEDQLIAAESTASDRSGGGSDTSGRRRRARPRHQPGGPPPQQTAGDSQSGEGGAAPDDPGPAVQTGRPEPADSSDPTSDPEPNPV